MKEFSVVENVVPLVEETLTNGEVIKLIKMGLYDTRTGPVLLDNVEYTSWEGNIHYGVLVSTKHPDGTTGDDYFMERTWTKVKDCGTYWLCSPTYHKLLPVMLHHKDNPEKFGTIPYLVADIIKKCYFDNVYIDEVRGLSVNDVIGYRSFKKSDKECEEYQKKKEALKESFISGDGVPAGDERWDNLLLGDKKDMLYVFDVLRLRGHNIGLDGEKDSFGWVTCGIVMDGELMTTMYF